MKILPLGALLFVTDEGTDGRMDGLTGSRTWRS